MCIRDRFAQIPELSDHVVFFNRVPKAGTEMLVLLMQWMQGINGFKHVRLPGGNTRRLTRIQQVNLIHFLFSEDYKLWFFNNIIISEKLGTKNYPTKAVSLIKFTE